MVGVRIGILKMTMRLNQENLLELHVKVCEETLKQENQQSKRLKSKTCPLLKLLSSPCPIPPT